MIFEDFQNNWKQGPTLIGFNESQNEHHNTVSPQHPESADRIRRIKEALQQTKVLDKCQVLTSFLEIDNGDLELTHEMSMVQALTDAKEKTQEEIDAQCKNYDSVFMTKNSVNVAKEGIACVRDLTNKIMVNEASNGFAFVRPPGHHADSSSPCGFCLFNNVAQAAEEAFFNGADRILIVDLDVHHGHGTQRIYYEDKRVLYFSIHRYEHGLYWPHLSESDFDHIGAGPGIGYNANVPLNETGCTDSDYLSILFHVLLPLATQFDPHFVIISAGFDSVHGDPLGGMQLTSDAYSHFVYHLKSLAQGRLLMVLEGGYNHQISAVTAQKCVRVLLGHAPSPAVLKEPPKESTVTSCINLVTCLRHYWNCFDYFPSRTSLRLAQWPIVNAKVEFEYDPSTRPADTGEIVQANLISEKISDSDQLALGELETFIYFNEGDEEHYDMEESNHPEKPARTKRILKTLRESEILNKCIEKNTERVATDEEIQLVHTNEMLDHLKATVAKTDEELLEVGANDTDSIYYTKNTLQVARKAVGAVLQSVDDIYQKSAGQRNALVIVRPPGHHASASKSSGFCIFNNVAVAAKYAQHHHNAKKVLILDWDVHHGNGTQEIFYEDPTVMYMSIHRHDKGTFYPCGEPKDYFDVGEGAGEGTSVNVPFSGADMGDAEYQMAFQRVIMPIAYQFNPDLVLISAGFDAAIDDPLGEYKITPETFAWMTYQLSSLAAGRIIAVLEGGYNLESISKSAFAVCEVLQNRAMIRRLRDEKEQFVEKPRPLIPSSIKTVREVCAVQQKHWSILKGFQVTPPTLGFADLDDDCIEMSDGQSSSSGCSSAAPTHHDLELLNSGAAHAVVPLSECPHLDQVQPLPVAGINAATSCSDCGIGAEVWTCLTCYKYNCGRFVNEHALMHNLCASHPMALSMADLSVWCYPCEAYVHNPILIPAKSSAHQSKFGEHMPS